LFAKPCRENSAEERQKAIVKAQGTVAIFNTKVEVPLAPTCQITFGGKE
jgi:hypothetical protein